MLNFCIFRNIIFIHIFLQAECFRYDQAVLGSGFGTDRFPWPLHYRRVRPPLGRYIVPLRVVKYPQKTIYWNVGLELIDLDHISDQLPAVEISRETHDLRSHTVQGSVVQ